MKHESLKLDILSAMGVKLEQELGSLLPLCGLKQGTDFSYTEGPWEAEVGHSACSEASRYSVKDVRESPCKRLGMFPLKHPLTFQSLGGQE